MGKAGVRRRDRDRRAQRAPAPTKEGYQSCFTSPGGGADALQRLSPPSFATKPISFEVNRRWCIRHMRTALAAARSKVELRGHGSGSGHGCGSDSGSGSGSGESDADVIRRYGDQEACVCRSCAELKAACRTIGEIRHEFLTLDRQSCSLSATDLKQGYMDIGLQVSELCSALDEF